MLFNITMHGHEVSAINEVGAKSTVILAHVLRSYTQAPAGEILGLTLYRCPPGDIGACLESRKYTYQSTETIDGHPCDVYLGRSSYRGQFGRERIWRPKDLPNVYWLKAELELPGNQVIEATLKQVRYEKLDNQLFQIPADYKPMGIDPSKLTPTGH